MKRKEFLKMTAGLAGGAAGLPLIAGAGIVAGAQPAPSAARLARAAAAGDDEYFWTLVRDLFILDPGWTFLNFGGLGSCPLPVLEALSEFTRAEERAPSAGHDEKAWQEVKVRLARALGRTCRPEDLGLIGGATEGVNVIVHGLPLKKGDEVITSTHEHVALHSALLHRMRHDGIVIRLFEPDIAVAAGNVDRIARLVTPKTRLIAFSHVTCTTGQLFPVKEIAALARAKNIWFALDGAQAPVCAPFDIAATGVDFYACSTHKWMMGPKRTGFIYVRPGLLDVLRPLTVGGGSSDRYDVAKGEFVLKQTAERYESGTQNDALFYALGTALELVETIGVDRIARRCRPMAERFYRGLAEIPGVVRLSPEEEAYRTLMIGFRMKGRTGGEIMAHLAKDRLRARPVTEGGLDSIRVSFYLNNRDEDVTAVLDSLKKLAA
ncbi:MAG TPA: aminotransferase class V-fold PLP-dependent enzyme [Candidatus Aminicenantes bacterium]|nr:aminotransferase class V-fold PLP-dependent enzyme [Candidatus Aminicenantes bacterium]HRY65765.1 aminotransferase class V-fold PLP-dependent enzyme [Candidatus Aminicenantes bacterium]HRZ72679.1 aminotransferase class V-fold PLP-dependent enzyme [Candidatus Aminicenantes bacterium]